MRVLKIAIVAVIILVVAADVITRNYRELVALSVSIGIAGLLIWEKSRTKGGNANQSIELPPLLHSGEDQRRRPRG